MSVKPFNRYLLIRAPEEEESLSGVLLPEDFKKSEEKYSVVTALAAAEDCKPYIRQAFMFDQTPHFLVRLDMVESVKVGPKEEYFILENHVLGLITNE